MRETLMGLWGRLALANAVLVVATATVVGTLSFYTLRALVVPSALEQIERHLRLVSDPIAEIADTAANDVLSATALSAVAGIVRAAGNGGVDPEGGIAIDVWRARLAQFFLRQLQVEPSYLQFRFIGVEDGGREIVRVNRSPAGNGVYVVQDAALQRKGSRPYFRDTVAASKNRVNLTPIELNEEEGEIETPLKPVFRAATPVVAPDGRPFGILIINIDLRVFFAAMRAATGPERSIYVANEAGQILFSPDGRDDFAFQRGGSARIGDVFPALGTAVAQRREVREVTTDRSGDTFGVVFQPMVLAGSEPIFVVEAVPYDVLTSIADAPQRSILLGAIIAAVCAIALALLVARGLVRPIHAMTRGAEAMERGERPKLPTKAGGEIGTLARAFESMASEVEEKRSSLTRALAEQQRINAELRDKTQRERLLSAAVETSQDAIFILDLKGRIQTWNQAAERLYGYSAAEMVGNDTDKIIPADRKDERDDFLDKVRHGEKIHLFETVRVKKDGTPVDVSLNISPVRDIDGRLIGASKIARDISDRKRADAEAAAQTEGLKRSNAELEQFAYVAAHDLQEPLRMVASYTELLAQRYKGQLDERADKYIAYAVDGAKRMKLLINDLLSFSRIGTKAAPLVPVETRAIVDAVVLDLDQTLRETNATVKVGELPAVEGDRSQLSQLFQNLIGNAVKFRSDAPPLVEIRAEQNDEDWLFSVADNGIGIDPQYGERIFQMFQRLHERERYAGSGIGLAVAKKIVERHGGRIWFDSQPGAGTTFYISFPKMTERLS
ncbi:sensor histidine kinase [Jiella mangrovi]|uniref:histidine kinase n=1 Tax=Jiella mangrovi TaxID=2821407 RepID=A0ABS4BN46_9HYPH|nr:ATP-binding protein [Jiella mangrovi]MBP0618148.1 PAS domain S-box protein [Jiella mangrovi]